LLGKPTERINKNAMMQLLQGSVVPQVGREEGREGGREGGRKGGREGG